jgi:hypothetical protein
LRRVDGRVVTRCLGIVRLPESADVIEKEKGRTVTRPANKNRFSRSYSEFRSAHPDSESAFLASLNWYGIAAERDCRMSTVSVPIDCSMIRSFLLHHAGLSNSHA